jgi:hypothetical protein
VPGSPTRLSMIGLPDAVRQFAEHLDAPGRAWLARLPALVAELERDWAITVVSPPLVGGTRSFVARVRTANGSAAVFKVGAPDDDAPRRIDVLRAAGGRGHALALRADAARPAMLVDALGRTVDALGLSPPQQIAALCATLRIAWRPAPEATAAQLREKADSLAESVARLCELGRPCPARMVDRALVHARRARPTRPSPPACTAARILGTCRKCLSRGQAPSPASSSSIPTASSGRGRTTSGWCCATGAQSSP